MESDSGVTSDRAAPDGGTQESPEPVASGRSGAGAAEARGGGQGAGGARGASKGTSVRGRPLPGSGGLLLEGQQALAGKPASPPGVCRCTWVSGSIFLPLPCPSCSHPPTSTPTQWVVLMGIMRQALLGVRQGWCTCFLLLTLHGEPEARGLYLPCYRGGSRGLEGAHASLELTLAWARQSQDTPSGLGSDVCTPHRLPGLRRRGLVLCDWQPPSQRPLTRRESMCLQGLAHSCVITPRWKRLRCTPAGACADSLWHIPTNIPILPQTAGVLDARCTTDGPWEHQGEGQKPDTQTSHCTIPVCGKSRRGECTRPSVGEWSEVGVGSTAKREGLAGG